MCIVYGLYNVNIHLPPFLGLPLSNKKSSANIHIMLKAILKAFNSIFFSLDIIYWHILCEQKHFTTSKNNNHKIG